MKHAKALHLLGKKRFLVLAILIGFGLTTFVSGGVAFGRGQQDPLLQEPLMDTLFPTENNAFDMAYAPSVRMH